MELVKRNIAGALAKLTEKESYIIKIRVMADNPLTLQEIGDRYHITRERARQIREASTEKACASPFRIWEASRPSWKPNQDGCHRQVNTPRLEEKYLDLRSDNLGEELPVAFNGQKGEFLNLRRGDGLCAGGL
jgi:hypothetical protein